MHTTLVRMGKTGRDVSSEAKEWRCRGGSKEDHGKEEVDGPQVDGRQEVDCEVDGTQVDGT